MAINDMPVGSGDYRDYEAEGAFDTLIRANQIAQDKKMMTRVQIAADTKAEEASRIASKYGTVPAQAKKHPDSQRENRVRF